MTTYISMLRGINVSGQKKIRMADLRAMYECLGLADVQSYVQSGNVIFASDEPDAVKLAGLIEAQIAQTFGFAVPVFIRRADDFQEILAANPFPTQATDDPTRLLVTFWYHQPAETALNELAVPDGDPGQFIIGQHGIFLYCPNGYGRSKLSNNFFERKLKVQATTRNWKTVNALYNMVGD